MGLISYPYGSDSDGYGIDDPDELEMAQLSAWLTEHADELSD